MVVKFLSKTSKGQLNCRKNREIHLSSSAGFKTEISPPFSNKYYLEKKSPKFPGIPFENQEDRSARVQRDVTARPWSGLVQQPTKAMTLTCRPTDVIILSSLMNARTAAPFAVSVKVPAQLK